MTFLIYLSVSKASRLAGGLKEKDHGVGHSFMQLSRSGELYPYISRKPIYWLWCDYWQVNSTNDCVLQRGVRFVWVLSMSDIAFCCCPQGLLLADTRRSEFDRTFSVRNVLCIGWLVKVCGRCAWVLAFFHCQPQNRNSLN